MKLPGDILPTDKLQCEHTILFCWLLVKFMGRQYLVCFQDHFRFHPRKGSSLDTFNVGKSSVFQGTSAHNLLRRFTERTQHGYCIHQLVMTLLILNYHLPIHARGVTNSAPQCHAVAGGVQSPPPSLYSACLGDLNSWQHFRICSLYIFADRAF